MSITEVYSGHFLDITDPAPEEIYLRDIACGLSKLCRYTGQIERFYSVAEHCVLMSQIVPEHLCAWALMHDAAEAYLGDIVQPVKDLLVEYDALEERMLEVIAQKYGLGVVPADVIKQYDLEMLKMEKDLVVGSTNDWSAFEGRDVVMPGIEPAFWTPDRAEKEFINCAKRVL